MFALNDKQKELRKVIREYVDENISPIAAMLDESGIYPREIIREIGRRGFCALPFSKELGGEDMGIVESVIFLEEISRGLASIGFIFCAHMLPCCYTLKDIVSPRQRDEWLIPAIRCEKLLTFAITEARGGSDAFAVDALAEHRPNGWLLNGSKCWITNAGVADGYIINAKTSTNSRSRSVSMFYVDANTPGAHVERRENMIGLNNSPTGTISFHDCLLPQDALIGVENEGYRPVKRALNFGRLGMAAISVGIAQSAFEKAASYAFNCGNYDRTLYSYQGVSFPIAEMYTNIKIAQNMLYHVADISQQGQSSSMETAALKIFASEMCQKVCQQTVLIHGGKGFISHSDVERMLRDSQLLSVAEGTTQICKVVISNGLFSAGPDKFMDL